MHDRIAELRGLRSELFNCENGPLRETLRENAAEVRTAIARVRGELEDQAAALEGRAEELAEQGQDGLAGQATEEARRIRDALAEDDAGPRTADRPKQTAADSRPKETASSRGGRSSGKS